MLTDFWCDESGGESVEWPLVVGVLFVFALAAFMGVKGEIIRVLGVIQAQVAGVSG